MRIICTNAYPWDAQAAVTDAWIAERRYLDSSSSVGQVNPSKGTIPLVQSTAGSKPAYSTAYGSRNLGMLTYDAVDDWMSGDALAAKVTGNPGNRPGDFTLIQSFELLAVAIASPWAFADTSNTSKLFTIIPQPAASAPNAWQINWFDDAAHPSTETLNFPAAVGKVVQTVTYTRSTNRGTIRLNGVTFATGNSSPSGCGQTTLSKFTIGAYRGSSAIQFCSMNWRATVFAPSILAASALAQIENYLIAEAA